MAEQQQSLLRKKDPVIPFEVVPVKDLKESAIAACYTTENVRTLRLWHNVAAGVHSLSFLLKLLVILINLDKLFAVLLTIQDGGVTRLLGTYNLSWLILAISPVTAIFHIVNGIYVEWSLKTNGTNWIRWTEYSISASIMTVVIAQTASVTDILILLLLVFNNVVMQLTGYIHEYVNQPLLIETVHKWNKTRTTSSKAKWSTFDWLPFILGSLLFLASWTVIFYYFFNAIAVSGAANVPWFVYVAIIGIFFQFADFAFWMIGHYTRPIRCCGCIINLIDGYTYEVGYILLSLISKVFLDWTLLIGSIAR